MPEQILPTSPLTDTAVMGEFLSKYGDVPTEKAPELSQSSSSSSSSSSEPDVREEGDGDSESLDAATLQVLGLASEDKESADQTGTEGTSQEAIDPAVLAATLGLDSTDLSYGDDGIRIKTKVDGQESEVSLADLRKGYQLQSHFTRQQEAFLAERQAWEQARQQKDQALQSQEAMVHEALNAEEQELNRQYTRNDWNELRQNDPAEYAAKVAEYNQELSRIRGKQQQLQTAIQQRQAEFFEKMKERSRQEAQLLAEKLKWTDSKSATEGSQQLRRYLIDKIGFNEQDVDTTVDHRSFLLADKARRYDELMAKVDLAKKKVATAPKMPKGTASVPEASESQRLRAAKERLAKDHTVESAADVFRQLKVI